MTILGDSPDFHGREVQGRHIFPKLPFSLHMNAGGSMRVEHFSVRGKSVPFRISFPHKFFRVQSARGLVSLWRLPPVLPSGSHVVCLRSLTGRSTKKLCKVQQESRPPQATDSTIALLCIFMLSISVVVGTARNWPGDARMLSASGMIALVSGWLDRRRLSDKVASTPKSYSMADAPILHECFHDPGSCVG